MPTMTAVFDTPEGSPNPFTTETPFGTAYAVGRGDYIALLDDIREALDAGYDAEDIREIIDLNDQKIAGALPSDKGTGEE